MLPIMYTVGPFRVYLFGLFLAASFLVSTFVLYLLAREEFKEEEYMDAYLYTSIIALISARLFYIVLNADKFSLNILRIFVVRETPGLSLMGGLLGGFVFLSYYCRKKKLPLYHSLDIVSLSGSFGLALAKLGEFSGGASFGKETGMPLGVQLLGESVKRHPVEIYEAILFFILGTALYFIFRRGQRKKYPDGSVFCIFTLFYAVGVFLLEFLKEYSVYLGWLSIRQLVAVLVLTAISISCYKRLKIIKSIERPVKGKN